MSRQSSASLSLEDALSQTPHLFRDGEALKKSSAGGSFFTFRKSHSAPSSASSEAGEKQGTPSKKPSLFTFRGKSKSPSVSAGPSESSRESSSESVPSAAGTVLEERIESLHTAVICDLISVPNEPPEVWALDVSGKVSRWPMLPVEESGKRVALGTFSTSEPEAHAMRVCGKHVWVGAGDGVEIRDFGGRLLWKIATSAFAIAAHATSADGAWLGGQDGTVTLMEKEEVKLTIQLTFRPTVTRLASVLNVESERHELWVLQGRVMSVIDQEEATLLLDLPCTVESDIMCVQVADNAVWMSCEDGRVLRWNVAKREVVQTYQPMEVSCVATVVASARLWAAGTGRSVRVLDMESGAPLDSIVNAHEEGGIAALTLSEVGGKLRLWSAGADQSIAVWSVSKKNPKRLSSLKLVSVAQGRDESDDVFDESASSVDAASSEHRKSSFPERSPRMLPRGLGQVSLSPPSSSSLSRSPPADGEGDEDDDDDAEPEQVGSGSSSRRVSSAKKKGKKRVLTKLLAGTQQSNVDKMRAAMDAVEGKEYEGEDERLAARQKMLDARGPSRRTALHVAAQQNFAEGVELLLGWGANVALKDKFDLVPVQLATDTAIKALLVQEHERREVAVPRTPRGSDPGSASKARHIRSKSVAVHSRRKGSNVTKQHPIAGDLNLNRIPEAGAVQKVRKSPRRVSRKSLSSSQIKESSRKIQAQEEAAAAATAAAVSGGASEAEVAAAVCIQKFQRRRAAQQEATQLRVVREKRKNIAEEMLKTEETYVRTLDVLVNKIRVTMSTQTFRADAGDLSEADIKAIFPASLSMLLSAHQSWVEELSARVQSWSNAQSVGDLYLQLSPYLKMYIVYVSNFEQSTLKIRELKKREKSRFAELVQEVFVNLGDPTNDLASMLVTPVQRIPRYVMMLKDLLKHTSTQHPDYANLLKAVKIMTDTTVLVDRKADDAKNSQKVLEVADSILEAPMAIVQPNRKWIKDGVVGLVVSATDIRPRYAYLFTDVLLLCTGLHQKAGKPTKKDEPPLQPGQQYRFQKDLHLVNASVQGIEDGAQEHLFVVKSQRTAFVLQARSAVDKSSWMKGLSGAIEGRKSASQSRQRGDVTGRVANNGSSPAMLAKMRSENDVFDDFSHHKHGEDSGTDSSMA